MASKSELHAKLITDLKGQVMHVPDMQAMFPNWPSGGRNKYYKRLKARLDEITETVYPTEELRRGPAKHDFAFFTSMYATPPLPHQRCPPPALSLTLTPHLTTHLQDTADHGPTSLFPDADWDEFYTCGLFNFWLFHCDDAMDEEQGSVALGLAASCRYRRQVLEYTRHCLDLPGPTDPPAGVVSGLLWRLGLRGGGPAAAPPRPNLPNGVFEEFGRRVRVEAGEAFRWGLYKEIEDYICGCEAEQKERLAGEMAGDLESYLRVRRSTSGVRHYGYITQLGLGMRLPIRTLQSAQMQALWDEMNLIIIIQNDILSLRKELTGGCVHNAVAVMYNQGRRLDDVVRELMTRLEASRDRFDELADGVSEMAGGADKKELLRYIDGLRTSNTGTLEFCALMEVPAAK
ncbi:isoprenoid synthase domain-containing protein [Lasiosphaeris hirsuta]|uniref:Terpene synthase n=1 Tax=Lasiosphaeris hirsuta TaxID=260670 RepID=A0AA40BDK5_9PEZI|nr:isoprenoid synthase domain-containing protein [Lasiosphaeris hirsuta]